MYQLYSLQRPGRPRWALAASAFLLLLTVVMAAALIEQKARARDVALGEGELCPAGGLRTRLPLGWARIPPSELPPGGVVGVEQASVKDRPGCRLFLFRGLPRTLGIPSADGGAAALRVARSLRPGSPLPVEGCGFGRVGLLPGWTLATGTKGSVHLSRDGRVVEQSATFYLTRAAVSPGGEVVGVLLELAEPPRRADEQLLEKISRHTELVGRPFADDPRAAMDGAGITFEPPPDARLVAHADPALPRIRMMGGDGPTTWYLDVHRVPLIGGRTPAALVEDHALSALQRTSLPEAAETTRMGDREVAHAHLSLRPMSDPSVYILSARTGDGTALLMVGRHEVGGGPALLNICRSIAETAKIVRYDDLIDIARAREAGRKWLEQIAREGLAVSWAAVADHEQVYAHRSPAITQGREVRRYEMRRREGLDWWKVTAKWAFLLPSGASWELEEIWSIRNDGAEHTRLFERSVEGPPEVQYGERRVGGAGRVNRELAVESGGKVSRRHGSVSTDETFTCEPVLIQAGARMASDPQQAPAVFSTAEVYPRGKVYWLMVPIGRAKLPAAGSEGSAWAVQMQADYDPSPITLYYDDTGVLLAVAFQSSRWSELIRNTQEKGPGSAPPRPSPGTI